MKKVIFIFLISIQYFTCRSQSLEFVRSVPFDDPRQVSIDRYNFVYISDEKGSLKKYDEEGKFQVLYSPTKVAEISLLEAWNTIKVFLFYREYQEYVMLERFLATQPNYPINENAIGFARMMTLASDYNLWVFDDVDFTLKKYDENFYKVLFSTPLELLLKPKEYEITFMREYQNQLFISDSISGVLVFDIFGNYKKRIPFKGISYFSFLNDYMTFISGKDIVLYDLYTFSEIHIPLPPGKKYTEVIVGPKYVYLFTEEAMEIYSYKLTSVTNQEK